MRERTSGSSDRLLPSASRVRKPQCLLATILKHQILALSILKGRRIGAASRTDRESPQLTDRLVGSKRSDTDPSARLCVALARAFEQHLVGATGGVRV